MSRRYCKKSAIDLIIETRDLKKVTIRRIARRAGVGVGLINYHFHTKEDCIARAVEVFINRIVQQWRDDPH
jgi:AcrR family transcriptional regulator